MSKIFQIMNLLSGIVKTSKERVIKNPGTTIGGGVLGAVAAALVDYLEEQSGCKFAVAFANIDWLQLVVFVLAQTQGALSTDANKTVEVSS